MATDGLLKLLAWLSPSFPVGAFAYSHALEAAIDEGLVADRASLERWIEDLLEHGGPRADSVFFVCTHRAVAACDEAAFQEVAEWAAAMRGSGTTAASASGRHGDGSRTWAEASRAATARARAAMVRPSRASPP